MGKFRIFVYDANDLEDVFDCYTEELGQAMILAKTQGYELYDVLKTKDKYLWHISNYSKEMSKGEITTIYGNYDTIGNPVISEIITQQ